MRRFVIGDIHGCSKALRTIVEAIAPQSDDQLIFLGDFIDRGPDSRGVIDLMITTAQQTRVIGLRGNHEVMLLGVVCGGCDPQLWLQSGGAATLASYGGSIEKIPPRHLEFFRSLRAHHETERELFIHAGYDPDVPADKIDDAHRYWNHLTGLPLPHCSGKRVFVGHTPQANGKVLDYGHLVCLDTYCFGGGWLTALDLDTDEVIQANRHGHLRRDLSTVLTKWLARWFRSSSRAPGRMDRTAVSIRTHGGAPVPAWRGGALADDGCSS
ncbi:MAG: metallophosphoesterase family protein [Planctomycetaceae bacterium]